MRRILLYKQNLKLFILILLCSMGWFFLVQHQSVKENIRYGPEEVIRLHVLANSDTVVDQSLKLKVRDAVLEHLRKEVDQTNTAVGTRKVIIEQQQDIQKIAQDIVARYGLDYPVQVIFGFHDFPVKAYGDFVLPAGRYEALRIMIGKAEGSNWWCVLFPPLCFIDITNGTALQPVVQDIYKNNRQDSEQPKITFKLKFLELWTNIKEN